MINVLVSVGDSVDEHQPVLELETDKAVIEVPSSISGKVSEIHVKEGEKASVGQLLLTIEDGEAAPGKKAGSPEKAETQRTEETTAAKEEPEQKTETEQPPQEPSPREPAAEKPAGGQVVDFTQKVRSAAEGPSRQVIPAAPSVRRLAREIGVDIYRVEGSGPQGRISQEDVKAYARAVNTVGGGALPLAETAESAPLPDFERWGPVRREKFSNVRRKTAEHMTRCWLTVPHVTQNDRCDITHLEARRKQYAGRVEQAGGKLTVTAIILKVLAGALRVFPQFNASIDVANQQTVLKDYIHIGVAVDTPRGLLVPVVRDVDRKNIIQLSTELKEVAEKARSGKVSPELLQGGTFTITNLGGIGGSSFTPIVNWPEVAILGVSRSRMEPVMQDGEFVPRNILPLSLSYDHRLIDGADAARFLRWVAQALEDPFLLMLEG